MYFATAKEMERLDLLAVESGLAIRQMMELAGFHMTTLFRMLDVKVDANVVVVCGSGNKGGGGLSAARHLLNHGWRHVSAVVVGEMLKSDPAHHLMLLEKMGATIYRSGSGEQSNTMIYHSGDSDGLAGEGVEVISGADVIIDALIRFSTIKLMQAASHYGIMPLCGYDAGAVCTK